MKKPKPKKVNKQEENQVATLDFKRKKWLDMSVKLIKTLREGYQVKPRGKNKKAQNTLLNFKRENEKAYEKFKKAVIAGEVRGLNYITFTQIISGKKTKKKIDPKSLNKLIKRYL